MLQGSLIRELEKRRGDREWKQLAAEIGISRSYLSDVVNGNKLPGRTILKFLGLELVITYRKTKEPSDQ